MTWGRLPVSLVHQGLQADFLLEGSILLEARQLEQFYQILHNENITKDGPHTGFSAEASTPHTHTAHHPCPQAPAG